ncbi:hypothetical protein HmCmsJML213_01503 [Escherichia coli]|nr:hypothetical protein HmCmsJML213_01503 [Escherichia coli]
MHQIGVPYKNNEYSSLLQLIRLHNLLYHLLNYRRILIFQCFYSLVIRQNE